MNATKPLAQKASLSAYQVAQFRRDGFLPVRQVFSPHEIAEIRDTFMDVARNGPVEGLSEGTGNLNRGGTAQYAPSDPLSFYPRMMHPHRHHELPIGPLSTRYMLDPRFYPYLHAGFAEEPVAVQSMFYFKPPGARGQAAHQDNFYLRVKPKTCMAAWIAVDDADPENGGMFVVPGSNRGDIICPGKADSARSFTTEFVDLPAGMKEVPTHLKAGDVLFFNGSLIHGSQPNTSKTRFRRALIFHYVPRASVELSPWYQHPTRFDGTEVEIPKAIGGGPCGVLQEAATSPH